MPLSGAPSQAKYFFKKAKRHSNPKKRGFSLDLAIQYLQDALELAPDNQKYRTELVKVQLMKVDEQFPSESPEVGKISITKDTQSEIVIKQRVSFRAMAWFVLILGISLLLWGVLALVGILPFEGEGAWVSFVLCGVSLLLVLVGTCMVGMITTKITFFRPAGYAIVTRSGWPIFLWFLRVKRISREEAKSVFVRPVARKVTVITSFTYYTSETSARTAYEVRVVMKSGKEEAVHADWNQGVSNYLARRILEFGRGQ